MRQYTEDGNTIVVSIPPICVWCKNLKGGFTCDAFPNGIPDDIRDGDNNHKKQHPDQVGELLYNPMYKLP